MILNKYISPNDNIIFEIEINSIKYTSSYLQHIIEYIKGERKSDAEVQRTIEHMIKYKNYKKYSSCEYETLDDLIKDYIEYLI
jgi:hypothetical protein